MSPRAYDLGERAKSVEQTRRRILSAAIDLFDAEGFRGASVDRIAQRADVTRATVYHHFGSKLGLLQALVEDASRRAGLDRVVDLGGRAATIQEVDELLRAFTEFWASNAVLFRNVMGLAGVDPDAATVVEARDDNRRRGIRALVERLDDKRILASGVSVEEAELALWMLTSFPVFDHLHRRGALSIDQTSEVLGRMAHGLFDREGTPNPSRGSGGKEGSS